MDELLTEFVAEARENLAALDDALLTLEAVPEDLSRLTDIFRLVHTIKGTCGFLGMKRLERIAHAAEGLLDSLRTGALAATPPVVSAVLAALDRVRLILTSMTDNGTEPEGDDSGLLVQLAAARLPTPEPPAPDHGWTQVVAPPGEDRNASSVRVSLVLLEHVLTLVSELVLTRNQLLQLARDPVDARLTAPLQRLSRLTTDLQETAMHARMQPVDKAWSKLPRLVRDLAAELGKPIRLVTTGAETALDRQVMELIRDPLTHLVRNCADHGLEDVQTRLAAGKPATGTIALTAYQEGASIVIAVADDGAGLRTERIRQHAVNAGLVSVQNAAMLTDTQVHQFIFEPGLSTADAISAVSGRGVGMDVVKANIQRLGGSVTIGSTPGAGTTFTLRIPLTMAILPALVVSAGGQRFALPQACVAELLHVHRTARNGAGPMTESLDGTPVLRLRGQLLPLVSLTGLLHLPPPAAEPEVLTIVVTVLAGWTVGLVVDRVSDTEEIVVKPLSTALRRLTIYGGSTILGDGSVIMILDPNGLAHAASRSAIAPPQQRPVHPAPAPAATRSAMLLVRLAPGTGRVAVPLSLLSRIEPWSATVAVRTGATLTGQCRGELIPLVSPPDAAPERAAAILVFTDRGRSVGLIVHEIGDVIRDELAVSLPPGRPGMLGAALLSGEVTEVIDTAYWLTQGWPGWFRDEPAAPAAAQPRLLVVDDSAFFRQLLVPTLLSGGYQVTEMDSAASALELRDGQPAAAFDAIISDIEMPGMDGIAFARAVRHGGPWQAVPLIALTGRTAPSDRDRAADAGFDEYVAKFDPGELLNTVRRRVAQPDRRAA